MRAKGIILFAAAGIFMLAGAAQGQVESPVGDANGTAAAAAEAGPGYKIVSTPIPFEVEYEFSRTVGSGRLLTVRPGTPGRLEKVYRVQYRNGEAVGKVLVDTRRVEPASQLIYMGRPEFETSRHSFKRSRVLAMNASAYDPSAGRGRRATFRTSSGLKAQFGVAAVDPRVIPLGTKLFIEGYGFALAADRGSAIKGNRIDLCYNSRGECCRFGRKKVTVHVLR